MNNLTRRALMAGIAASPLAALPALPAVASAAPSYDIELLRLEAQLVANNVEYFMIDEEETQANRSGLPAEHLRAAMDRIMESDNEIETAILNTPAHSGSGIAVKLRHVLRLGGQFPENFGYQDLLLVSAIVDALNLGRPAK